MAAKKKMNPRGDPQIVVEGIEDVLEQDLLKHKGILERTALELEEFRKARDYEVRRKKHYQGLVDSGKYDRGAMEKAIEQININMRHMADKIKLSRDKIFHHTEIKVRLEQGLANQYRGLRYLKEQREDGIAD